jgi:hypothetical protein
MSAKSGELDRFPGLEHALLPRALHPDPGATVLHEVRAHARLELVARADLAAVRLHEACVHGEMLRASRTPPRDPAQQPAVRLKQHRSCFLTGAAESFVIYRGPGFPAVI